MSKWSIWGYIFIFIANFFGLLSIFLIREPHIDTTCTLLVFVMAVCFFIAIYCLYISGNSSRIEFQNKRDN